jgi:glutamate--cysteine ligase
MNRPDSVLDPELLLADLMADLFPAQEASSDGPPLIGVELELIPLRSGNEREPISLQDELIPCLKEYAQLTGMLTVEDRGDAKPGFYSDSGGHLSFEPGGQVEYSSPPLPGAAAALRDVRTVVEPLQQAAAEDGIILAPLALNPWHSPEEVGLQTPVPRYRAMQAALASIGPWGLRMMRLTGAQQVNLDPGPPEGSSSRWRTLQLLSPVLTAVFANSPIREGRGTGDRSHRSRIWQGVDPSRTGFIIESTPQAYLEFALDARVLIVRLDDENWQPGTGDLTFRRWLQEGHEGRRPTIADWRYHLTTLFPEVRPRGALEVRYIDSQPRRWWDVPAVVLSSLAYVESVRQETDELLLRQLEEEGGLAGSLERAAAGGLSDARLLDYARQIARLVMMGLESLPEDYVTRDQRGRTGEFFERYTLRGRSPADEVEF